MAHLSKIFSNQKVDVPNRSGFDMSHENLLTMTCGTLTPVLVEEVLPNETYSLGYMAQVQAPPMATDFYGRVDMRVEAFFVPNRILWGGWQNFMTMPVNNPFSPNVIRPTKIPAINAVDNSTVDSTDLYPLTVDAKSVLGAGSLADFLGFKMLNNSFEYPFTINNMLPFLAYHKIYDDWYRNPNVTKPLFTRISHDIGGENRWGVSNIPWTVEELYSNNFIHLLGDGNVKLLNRSFFFGNDNASSFDAENTPNLFYLHQRQWAKDYYTTASLFPQSSGDLAGSSVEVGQSPAGSNSFTIGQLRSANVLQRWLERNNIAGQRYSDQIKATWGIMPSDALLDRPIFLGSHKFGIYNKSVSQQTDSPVVDSRNPYAGSLGNKGGSLSGLGDGSIIDKFTSTEHGFIVVLASIVPHAYYSTGRRRYLKRSEIGDFANPLLQGLGEQSVYLSELYGTIPSIPDADYTFGYQQQYSEYKYHDDEVHGLLRDGESLQAFALQRGFDASNALALSTQFLEIPKNFLDGVTAASYENGSLFWADFFFNFRKISPLAEYVIPTLGDLKNTHKEDVPYRGRYF